MIENHAEPACPQQPEVSRDGAPRGVALSEIEARAALQEILQGPSSDIPDDDDDIVDPHEGWEPVPVTWDELIDRLKSVDDGYDSIPWWTRRYWIAEWLIEVDRSYGPLRCLDDLISALFCIDDEDRSAVHPLLQPDYRPGRPKLTQTEFRNRCMVALAIDALKVAGLSVEKSAKTVAGWLSKRGNASIRIRTIRYSSVPVHSWETVKHWREEIVRIAGGKGQHGRVIRKIAAEYLGQRDRLPGVIAARGMDPQKLAVLLLRQMRPLS
jgi:hypothetical protein